MGLEGAMWVYVGPCGSMLFLLSKGYFNQGKLVFLISILIILNVRLCSDEVFFFLEDAYQG